MDAIEVKPGDEAKADRREADAKPIAGSARTKGIGFGVHAGESGRLETQQRLSNYRSQQNMPRVCGEASDAQRNQGARAVIRRVIRLVPNVVKMTILQLGLIGRGRDLLRTTRATTAKIPEKIEFSSGRCKKTTRAADLARSSQYPYTNNLNLGFAARTRFVLIYPQGGTNSRTTALCRGIIRQLTQSSLGLYPARFHISGPPERRGRFLANRPSSFSWRCWRTRRHDATSATGGSERAQAGLRQGDNYLTRPKSERYNRSPRHSPALRLRTRREVCSSTEGLP